MRKLFRLSPADDIHAVGRNASSTRPATFLVFLLKREGGPVLEPVQPGSEP
jgi:hypothetical protein